MKFKIPVIIHFIGIALAILRLCFIPFEDHLRYGIGHIICWLVVISATFAFFYIPQTAPLRKWMKVYFGIYFFNTCFMALLPLAINVLFAIAVCIPEGWRLAILEDCFVQALIPKTVECENSTYIIRKWDDVNQTDNSERLYLYRKEMFVEQLISIRYAGDFENETYHAKRILGMDKDREMLKIEVEAVPFIRDSIRVEVQEWSINKSETE